MSDHIDPNHLLHWDRPLHEQSPYVQQRLTQLLPATPQTAGMTGGELHDHLAASGGHHGAGAERLLQAGIPGISYANAADTSGPRHVVFDQATRGTIARHGLARMIAAGADALREHKRGSR